jgi:glutathione S-transferase
MRLYDNTFSPFARKVRMVLDYKGLAVEAIDGLLPDARARLAAVNPRVEVPVLEDGDVTVVNSSDIVAYLEARYPDPPVYPAELRARVAARAWERRADAEIDAILHDASIWTWPTLDRHDAPPPGLLDAARADLERVYDDLERALASHDWVCGPFSIADIALFPHLSAVRFLGIPFTAERHPRLLDWYRRARRLPPCEADLARARAWLGSSAGRATKVDHVVWRGDRIEWLLAHGFHEWFIEEIRSGRVGWPRR